MGESTHRLVARGHAALRDGDLDAARAAFAEAATHAQSGEVLAGLAEATYRTVDFPAARELYGRAFTAYEDEGRPLDAARVARTLAYQHALHGDGALVSGWTERARRLAAGATDSVEWWWAELFGAFADRDPASRERRLRELVEAGRRLGDRNLEHDARALLGRMCVDDGRLEEGLALLDEVLAAIRAGEVDELVVVEGAFCLMLGACETTQDLRRAEWWTVVGEDLTRERGLGSLGALCRGYLGGILIAAGRYAEAEEALTDTVRRLERGYALARDGALVRLADLRLRQGSLEAAAELLRGLEEHPDAAHPLAALLLARGEPVLARERIDRALPGAAGVVRGRLLALLVDVQLAAGDVDDAAVTASTLADLAARGRSRYLDAVAALARGRVCVTRGSPDARACLRDALAGFARARMPLELALARLDLAEACTGDQPEVAVAEARLAYEACTMLGAGRHADRAAALLRALGAPPGGGPRGPASLTGREAEVLGLLGHGLSNPEIAERLVISRKTVEHHVSRVLDKLGLRNRAEAAAFAVRRPTPGR